MSSVILDCSSTSRSTYFRGPVRIVRSTECFQTAERREKLLRVPTGDGMALLFFGSPEEPPRCAMEISQALKSHPDIRVRMGVHSGPVNRVTDLMIG